MATPQNPNDQNTGQNPGYSPTEKQSKEVLQFLKEKLRLEGDYRDTLKYSIKDLNATLKTYEKIEAKLASINRSAINTKQIESQIKQQKEKQYIDGKKLADLEEKMLAYTKQSQKDVEKYIKSFDAKVIKERELLQAQISGDKLKAKQIEKALFNIDKEIERRGDLLNHEQLSYVEAKKTKQLNDEIYKKQQDQLKTEIQVSRQLGISGNLMGIFAKKIGLGEDAYAEMTEKSRELVEQQKKMGFFEKTFSKFTGSFKVLGVGIGSIAKSIFSNLLDPLSIIGAGGLLLKGLKSAFDYIVGVQDQTVKFARAMNISTGAARQIKGEFASLSVSSGDLFINTQKMVESQMEMVDALGVTNRLSNEILATNIKLKDIAGLDLETRKGIIEASTVTGKNSETLTKSILAQVVGLKQATGIQFQNQKILKEAAAQGGYLGLQFAKYPEKLTKSLLTVKAMGMELKQLDSMADSFLDFESSISKEFEAQLLTGKNINLMRARELFLNNDLAGAAAEINSQIGSSADFLKLNRIQADSLAQAFGMSRDQMGDMLKQQEILAKLGAKQGDNAREQLRIGLERYKTQKELTAAIGEEAYQNLINASSQEKIAAFVEKIKQSIADFVEKSGIIDKIESVINYLSKPENIRAIIVQVRDFFASAVEAVLQITNGIINAIDFITFGFGIDEEFERKFEAFSDRAAGRIRSLGGNMMPVTVSPNIIKNNERGSSSTETEVSSKNPNYMNPPKIDMRTTNNFTIDGRSVLSSDTTTMFP